MSQSNCLAFRVNTISPIIGTMKNTNKKKEKEITNDKKSASNTIVPCIGF